jgi:hypothetical protein
VARYRESGIDALADRPPVHGPEQLRQDLGRFTFLLGGSGGEELFGHDDQ